MPACRHGPSGDHRMVDNLFPAAVPVKLSAFPVCPCSHYACNRMPETSMDMSIWNHISVPHAINPVIEMIFAVIAYIYRAQFHPVFFSSNYFCLAAFNSLFHPFIKIKASGKILVFGNKKPSRTSFPSMGKKSPLFPADTGIIAKHAGII